MNYAELLFRWAERTPEKVFLSIDGARLTYGETARRVEELAGTLPGLSRRLTAIYTDSEYLRLLRFFAVQRKGGVPLLLHCPMPQRQLDGLCAHNPVGALWNEGGLRLLPEAGDAPKGACSGVLTSGSSGAPKVLFRTYESWADFFPVQNRIFSISQDTNLLFSGSSSFTGNLNLLLGVLYAGGTLTGVSAFHPRSWLRRLEEGEVNSVYLVPVKLRTLLHGAKGASFPQVRSLITGSMLLYQETYLGLRACFPQSDIVLYYGATEANYITYLKNDDILRHPTSVGRPFPGVQVTTERGEIWIDTPYHVIGFPDHCTVHDAGELDGEGYLQFLGRTDDVINRNGFKISISKVEAALLACPGVTGGVVLPYDHPKYGQQLAAFFCGAAAEAVSAALRRELMEQELPGRLIPLERMPLNVSGKPDLPALRAYLGEKK